MHRDIRETALYREAETLYQTIRQPGTGQFFDAAELNVSPDGMCAVFSATMAERLDSSPPTRIARVDLTSGATQLLTFGPNSDRLPKFSPDGRRIAFLSDRHKAGDFQLHILDLSTGAARATPRVDGWVEYHHWSPDGTRILLGVAGHGADIAGGQGAVTSKRVADEEPSWTPSVETGDESCRWRRTWVYELAANRVHQVSPAELNVWEANWCGNEAFAAVSSCGPGEGLWYSAKLHVVSLDTQSHREVYEPRDQLGCPAASPSGRLLAIVEAVCSDRWVVAGELRVLDTVSGKLRTIDTAGVDVTYAEWRSETRLLIAGHRAFETVVGLWDAGAAAFRELWSSSDVSTGGLYVTASAFGDAGDCILVGEGFRRAPEIALIRRGEYRTVKSLDLGYAQEASVIHAIEQVVWRAPDGLELHGWLLRPEGMGPHPILMNVHGGPVWQWRPTWPGRRTAWALMLLRRGFCIFYPNPRGSIGRGQDFIRLVLGDMGGVDTYDYLSGIDHLVEQGIADPRQLGVMGGSYGGFMSAWLITQDSRFAAAIPVSPVINQVTEHLLSNIPHFVSLFLADAYTNPTGKYFQRSPVMHAHKVTTPTLNVCGALDRCTPPEEARQFHSALLENGKKSLLVTYPEEGHGVRKFPAVIDFAARVVDWLEQHMAARVGRGI